MINVIDLVRQEQPLWIVDINDHPLTGLPRVFEADALYIASWGVTLRGLVYFKDVNGNKINSEGIKPYRIELTAGLTASGPFIDPMTGLRVYPDADGNMPDGTMTRYDALMYKLSQNVNINDEVISYIQNAVANGEFDPS